jgi:hypothetical protein
MKTFARYLVAICVGIAVTLGWQAYGEGAKQLIARRAPELGWSPAAKQTIASWVSQLGGTRPSTDAPEDTTGRLAAPQAAPVEQAAQAVAPSPPAPAAPPIDPQQIQRIERDLAEVRGAVEQLATAQDQISRDIAKLQTGNQEILEKISAAAPRPATTQGRARSPAPRPSSAAPMPLH